MMRDCGLFGDLMLVDLVYIEWRGHYYYVMVVWDYSHAETSLVTVTVVPLFLSLGDTSSVSAQCKDPLHGVV